MVKCSAFGCSSKTGKSKEPQERGLSYFKFPKQVERRNAWIRATKLLNWEPTNNSVLCSKHFEEQFVDRSSLFSVRLEKNAIPTIFHGFPAHLQKKNSTRKPPMSRENIVKPPPDIVMSSQTPSSNFRDMTFASTSEELHSSTPTLAENTQHTTPTTSTIPHLLDTPRKKYLKQKISDLTISFKKDKKILQQKIRRRTKKIADLKNVISSLRKFLPDEKIETLQSIGG